MKTRLWLTLCVSFAVLIAGGCPTDTPGGTPEPASPGASSGDTGAADDSSGTTGGTTDGSAGDADGTGDTTGGADATGDDPDDPPATLTDAQDQLAKMLATKQVRLNAVLGALSVIAEPDTIPSEQGVTQSGLCPVILAERQGDAVALQLDYGTGCQASQSAVGNYAGVVLVVVDEAAPNFTSTFTDIAVDGENYSGFVGPAVFQPQRESATLAGSITIDDEDTDATAEVAVTGDVTAVFDNQSGAITLTSGTVFFARDLDSYEVTISNVVCNSTANGNFVPQSGTITATALDGSTFSVTFSSTSPAQHQATASVDGGEAVTFDLE